MFSEKKRCIRPRANKGKNKIKMEQFV